MCQVITLVLVSPRCRFPQSFGQELDRQPCRLQSVRDPLRFASATGKPSAAEVASAAGKPSAAEVASAAGQPSATVVASVRTTVADWSRSVGHSASDSVDKPASRHCTEPAPSPWRRPLRKDSNTRTCF